MDKSLVSTPLADNGWSWLPRRRSSPVDTTLDFDGALQQLFRSTNGDMTGTPLSHPPMIGMVSGFMPTAIGDAFVLGQLWSARTPYGPMINGSGINGPIQPYSPGQLKQGS